MRGRATHTFGTDIRTGFDQGNLRKAGTGIGTDLRYWVGQGTVASINGDGEFNFTDPKAIWNGPEGVTVDVRMEPLDIPIACQYAGESAGGVTIMTPITPGDRVLVECPDGDLTTPIITKILQSGSNRQPSEGGRPIFDNRRLLVYAKAVPIDLRTSDKTRILMEQNGTVTVTGTAVKLGGSAATEKAVLGTTQASELTTLLGDIAAAFAEIDFMLTSPASATAALSCGTFVSRLQSMLSGTVRVLP
jgi:hypothetical protein